MMRIKRRLWKSPEKRSHLSNPSQNPNPKLRLKLKFSQKLESKTITQAKLRLNPSQMLKPKLSLKLSQGQSLNQTSARRLKRRLNPRPRRHPTRSHERQHVQPPPKTQQRRRSSISRPHHESLGGVKHRPIREIGARVGRLLSHRGTWLGRVLSGKRASRTGGKTERTNRCGSDWRGRVWFRPATRGAVQ